MGEGVHIYRKGGSGTSRSKSKSLTPEERRKRGTARLIEKGNINGGLTEAQRIAVTKRENKDRNLKTERVTVIDKNGREIARSTSGSRSQTRLPRGNFKDAVITHNHPNEGSATRVGISLSGPDLASTIHNQAAEIRAVSSGYTYSLRRPKSGWGADAATVHNEWMSAWNKGKKERLAYVNATKTFNERNQRLRRVNSTASHQITRDIAKKYGWEYTRRRTE